MKFFRDPTEGLNLTEMSTNANPYEITESVREAIDARQNKGILKLAAAAIGAVYAGTLAIMANESSDYLNAIEFGLGLGVGLLAISGVTNLIEARRATERATDARRTLS